MVQEINCISTLLFKFSVYMIRPVGAFATDNKDTNMDTGTLYNWANEAGLNFQDDDGYSDAISVWVDEAMQSPEHLEECWIDFVVDKPAQITQFLAEIGKADHDLQFMAHSKASRGSDNLQFAYANAAIGNASRASEHLRRAIREGLEKYVTDNADTWWKDCCGYHSDMMEGRYEDHKYQEYKERQLEAR